VSPATFVVASVVVGVGVAMTRLGLDVGLLRQRVTPKRCAFCGRRMHGRGCKHCGS
jgi:hypothetical protein